VSSHQRVHASVWGSTGFARLSTGCASVRFAPSLTITCDLDVPVLKDKLYSRWLYYKSQVVVRGFAVAELPSHGYRILSDGSVLASISLKGKNPVLESFQGLKRMIVSQAERDITFNLRAFKIFVIGAHVQLLSTL